LRNKETQRRWLERNKDRLKRYRKSADLKKQFGIGLDDYNRLHAAQEGRYAVCLQPETQQCYRTGEPYMLAVDHCHKSGAVRQLLCSRCNRTLGMVGDSVDLLDAMIAYIKKHSQGRTR
jgi:hypothetical protein